MEGRTRAVGGEAEGGRAVGGASARVAAQEGLGRRPSSVAGARAATGATTPSLRCASALGRGQRVRARRRKGVGEICRALVAVVAELEQGRAAGRDRPPQGHPVRDAERVRGQARPWRRTAEAPPRDAVVGARPADGATRGIEGEARVGQIWGDTERGLDAAVADQDRLLAGAVGQVRGEREVAGRAGRAVDGKRVAGDELLAAEIHLQHDVVGIGLGRRARVDLPDRHVVKARLGRCGAGQRASQDQPPN